MRIFHHLDDLAVESGPLHLAMGVFDGVHVGHQAVIGAAVEAARTAGGKAGLLTFSPNPIQVIAPEKAPAALLATLKHKLDLAAALGAELALVLPFDAELARVEADEFVARVTRAAVRTIAVGEDWRFGHLRRGDVNLLQSLGATHGFVTRAVSPVMFDGDRVSSTRIRQAIHDGNLAEASRMLGREYTLRGVVCEGRKLGRELGFPTANLETSGIQLPPGGVWKCRARWHDEPWRLAAANLGTRPTLDGTSPTLEVHVLDFDGDLYGREIEIAFDQHLRPERKFASLDELKAQIARDVAAARCTKIG